MSEQGLGNTVVVQIAVVVRDIEAKAKAWADVLGVPVPPVIISDTLDKAQTRYHGQPTEARVKMAFFKLGDQVDLELFEPEGEPSEWADSLRERGEGVHHIAFRIKGMAENAGFLESKGFPLIQKGEYTGGRYAFFDSLEKLGLKLELLEND